MQEFDSNSSFLAGILLVVFAVWTASNLMRKGRQRILSIQVLVMFVYVMALLLMGALTSGADAEISFSLAVFLPCIHFLVLLVLSFFIHPTEEVQDTMQKRQRTEKGQEATEERELAESEYEDGNWIFGDDWKEEMEDGERQ